MPTTSRKLSRYVAAALAAMLSATAGGQDSASARTGAVRGRLTTWPDGKPIAGATVTIEGTSPVQGALSDSAGDFRIERVRPGGYTVRIRLVGYQQILRRDVRVAAGRTAFVDERMRPQGTDGAYGGFAVALDSAGRRVSRRAPKTTWLPTRPRQGSLVKITVWSDAPPVEPELAGEPLHFFPDGPGKQSAIAAVPIDAADTISAQLGPAVVDGVNVRHVVRIPVAKGNYPLERLSVAPQFGREPDSALAERMRREGQLAADVSAHAHETPRLWRGPWGQPRPGRITSSFGRGRQFNGVVQSRHMGTDFAGAVGAEVRAPARGVVRLVEPFFLGGNVIYLDHGAGLVSAYLHLSEQLVAVGDTVAKGQLIGRVGATGRVTGPHLHWILRYGSITVDPMSIYRMEPPPKKPPVKKTAPRRKRG